MWLGIGNTIPQNSIRKTQVLPPPAFERFIALESDSVDVMLLENDNKVLTENQVEAAVETA